MLNYKQIIRTAKPDMKKLPGGWAPSKWRVPSIEGGGTVCTFNIGAMLLQDVLTHKDCSDLIEFMSKSPSLEPVSVQGMDLSDADTIGSHRTTVWSPALAEKMWNLISEYFDYTEYFGKFSATDWWQGDKERHWWKAIGMSPMLRFMKYEAGGEHYAHYDAGFIYPDDNYRTLKSVVIYLTSNFGTGGSTRLINDQQSHIPIWDREHNDWSRPTLNSEVQKSFEPIRGSMLIFDHRKCHDVEKYLGNTPRIIIRADILYRAS